MVKVINSSAMQKLNCLTGLLILFLVSTGVLAQDWPQLKRFQKENAQISIPKKGEQRVVFMGNSITEGWLQKRPLFFFGKSYINRGISGQTTPQMLLRFRQDVIHLKPTVVVILAGINDIAGNTGPASIPSIEDNIISMVELAKANQIEVVLCSVLPASYFPWKPKMKPGEKVVELNGMLKQYITANQCIYVDLHSAMVNAELGLKKELSYDGVHPNAIGYAVMEPLVEAGIKEALLQKK